MMASLAKDPTQAAALMEKYQAETALDVLLAVHRHRRTWRDRLLSLVQHITGNFAYDPLPGMMAGETENPMRVEYRLRSVDGGFDE